MPKAGPSPTRGMSLRSLGIRKGYRSGLEEEVGADLAALGIDGEYEKNRIEYVKPAAKSRYTPDFRLPNGIYVETKGRFVAADRIKHQNIKRQHPELDIRFVFSNPNARLTKTSRTTYADWCDKHGFKWAKRSIPPEWIAEPPKT